MAEMADLDSIGLVELSSIAIGYLAQDAMLKSAPVELLQARTICSGKYIVVVGGDVAAVTAAVEGGVAVATGALIERRVIPRVHPSVSVQRAEVRAGAEVGALRVGGAEGVPGAGAEDRSSATLCM
jgi:microcompartment protein CcmL/EutN